MTMSDRSLDLGFARARVPVTRCALPAMGLALLAGSNGCRESPPFPETPPPPVQPSPYREPPPPPIDAMPARPRADAYVQRPDAAPPPGLGPYANLHEAFKARCPITLPEPPRRLQIYDKEFLIVHRTGRSCAASRSEHISTFWIAYTEGDSAFFAEPRGYKDGYDRIAGAVDEIELSYRSQPPGRRVKACDTIPDELSALYQLTSKISDRAKLRLAATLRVADRVVPSNAYGRIRIEDRVIYTSTDLGPRDLAEGCRGRVESGDTLGLDPVIVDVPLADPSDDERSK